MRVWNRIAALALLAFLSAGMRAAEIKGTVTNATTNEPAAGDDVIVFSLAGGMEEAGHGKTDGQGRFAISISADNAPHLVRVIHQGVNYHKPATNSPGEVNVTVYDSARQVDNIIGEGRVLRILNAGPQQLEISETYVLRNESSPPRTRMSEQSFQVTLPGGAQVEEAMAAGPSGMPVNTDLSPTGKKGRYAFSFPVRPGRTQFQVTYRLPYNGSHEFTPGIDMPLAEFGVMLPKSMRFTSKGEMFRPAADESGMAVFVANGVSPGTRVRFSVAGEGKAPANNESASNPVDSMTGPPGSGPGAPVSGPEPPGGPRWYVIAFLSTAFAAGAFWLWRHRARSRPDGMSNEVIHVSMATPRPGPGESAHASSSQDRVLDAIKEELFLLETDQLQGEISPQEYDAARRGLEALMRRQMKKQDYPQAT